MKSAAQAYGNVSKQISSPRKLEADLLLEAASRLQAVQNDRGENGHDRCERDRPSHPRQTALRAASCVSPTCERTPDLIRIAPTS